MASSLTVTSNTSLDFNVILDALLSKPESYVNFGEYWWTLKRMLADWAEEHNSAVNPQLIRGTKTPAGAPLVEEWEVYQFFEQFSGSDDFLDWISYVNPRLVWDRARGEEVGIEDPEWEALFC